MTDGWVKLHRKLFDNELWLLEPFTKAQAWIDLVGNANHKAGIISIRGNIIEIKRGQIGWSELTMAKRWRWSREKVRRFLMWLETRQQITQKKERHITSIITILNYEKYQDETADQTTEKQQKDNRRDINKNDKNVKNEKKNTNTAVSDDNFKNLESLTPEVVKSIADKYHVPLVAVQKLKEQMELYCLSNGKRYKNYKLALMQWTLRRIEEGKLTPLQVKSSSILEMLKKAGRNDIDFPNN